VSYRPQEFWEQRLEAQFDLRGTGETGLSLAYNRACYRLRGEVLAACLQRAGLLPGGRRVLDVGCGTGFWTEWYVSRGAHYTGVDIAQVSVDRLAQADPEQRFVRADVSEGVPGGPYDIVNVFDVLYHITDDARWEAALRRLARAVAPGGLLLVSDVLAPWRGRLAAHNVMRELPRYAAVLRDEGLAVRRTVPTHYLLNRSLGALKGLNRLPHLLHAIDRVLLALGAPSPEPCNRLLVARRGGAAGG
jgi:SAM-dependent methyltransferase